MRTIDTYQDDVKSKYLKDKVHGTLRGNLYKLTPNTIRTVCLNIIDETLSEEDKTIMKNFFYINTDTDLRNIIKKYDLEKLKPICNFLKKEEGATIQSPDALELVALIINFKPRPYINYRQENISNRVKEKEPISVKKQKRAESKKEEKENGIVVIIPPLPPNNQEIKSPPNNSKGNTNTNRGNSTTNRNSGRNGGSEGNKKNFIPTTGNIKVIVISSIILLSAIIIIPLNKARWMIWQNGEYKEVTFDTNKYNFKDLEFYKKDLILSFRQIKNPSCNITFFKPNGKPNVWYGKNAKGEHEYFTSYGLHPENGKTLKKITKHIIKTHICDTYK